jgi:hypothetical protein
LPTSRSALSCAAGAPSGGAPLDLATLEVLLRHSAERLAVLSEVLTCADGGLCGVAALLHTLKRSGSQLTAAVADRLMQQVGGGAAPAHASAHSLLPAAAARSAAACSAAPPAARHCSATAARTGHLIPTPP